MATMKAQGQSFSGTPATAVHSGPPVRARRSALVASIGASVMAIVLSTAALTILARPTAATPTTTTSATATTPTSTVDSTSPSPSSVPTATGARARTVSSSTPRTSTVVGTSSTPTTRSAPSSTPASHSAPASTPSPTASVAVRLSANIVASPDFQVSGTGRDVNGVVSYQNPCVSAQSTWPAFTNDPHCTDYVLSAIDHARAIEGLAPMVLPTNWFTLTTAQQLFVVADLERTARGLHPYLGLNATLSAAAQGAAQANADPSLAPGFPVANDTPGVPAMGGAWSGGYSVLVADYVWMYADGWAGNAAATSNIACTSAHAPGCWAHRAELLGSDPGYNPGVGLECANCEMGTGFAMVNGAASYVDLIEAPRGPLPPVTFTWVGDVLPYLG